MYFVWCWCKFFNVKVILTLYVNNNKKRKDIAYRLFSWICLWFTLWVLTNSNIVGNCFHLFISKGDIWGQTWSNTQPSDMWLWAYSHCFANRPGQDVYVRSYYTSNNWQLTFIYFVEFMFLLPEAVDLVIVFYMET